MLAQLLGRELIRLQCYEGIDASQALYEWNYSRQLIAVRAMDAADAATHVEDLFGPEFLVERPLLAAIRAGDRRRAARRRARPRRRRVRGVPARDPVRVRGHDPRDRAGWRPTTPPAVVVTSNRTRELHDALKRRCLYHWIDHPQLDREVEIVRARAPHVSEGLARDVAEAVARLRELDLAKLPGVAETIDWANALAFLGADGALRVARRRHARRRREGPRGPGARRRPPRRGRRRAMADRRLETGRPRSAPAADRGSAASCAGAACPSAPGASSRSSGPWTRSGSSTATPCTGPGRAR